MKVQLIILSTFLLLAAACKQEKIKELALNVESASPVIENTSLPGADILAFGPDNILFVGDSKNARIHAIETEAIELKDAVPYNLEGIDNMLSEKLGIELRDVVINDMKIHPVSQEAYISIKKGHSPDAESMIAIVSPTTSEIRFVEMKEANTKTVTITNPASADLKFWNETPASSLTITDIDYSDDSIFVSGLTNGEFASNIRKIAYPFDQSKNEVNSIEIYHAVHTQMETRAPIRTMLIDELDGTPTIIASYTCTPLVTIPTSEIKENANVKGKTIAELGYGNTPIDMIIVQEQGMDGSVSKSLLVTHKNRGGSLIPFNSIVEGAEGKGMAGMQAMDATGLDGIRAIPTANVMQIDVQNQMFLTMVRRNIESGEIDLISEITGSYLRLSDFISEYDFPDYRYSEAQQPTKQYHDMAKQMEGYPELTSEAMSRN
ncbi:hypothetical protein [Croceitalea rosinachiae]|uniref:Uncharacterized protein n=1 Tax=Croceitalea rosinachiae TaxID=3075596 RepID=A0ABU3ACL2_9FLAO|nr:hypothetical protein [Croceitalea sp. F388]MDT0607724.1 hypothetical protein [Croceitalea sp. F388]